MILKEDRISLSTEDVFKLADMLRSLKNDQMADYNLALTAGALAIENMLYAEENHYKWCRVDDVVKKLKYMKTQGNKNISIHKCMKMIETACLSSEDE